MFYINVWSGSGSGQEAGPTYVPCTKGEPEDGGLRSVVTIPWLVLVRPFTFSDSNS